MLWHTIEGTQTQLTNTLDQLIWKWTSNGSYSARSSYLATFQGSATCPAWKHIWKTWAPPRVKFFHWLAFQDRCWTADRVARRGLQHHPRCLLCDQAPETMRHLFIECPFAKQSWHDALAGCACLAACRMTQKNSSSSAPRLQNLLRTNLFARDSGWQHCYWKHRNDS